MISIIYQFKIKEGKLEHFIKAWKELTILIYQYENSLGSRLHKKDSSTLIAYAQWPDKQTWKNSGNKLPLIANDIRNKMRESCENIEVLHELVVLEDLLENNSFK